MAVDVLEFRLPPGAVRAGDAAAVIIVAAGDHKAALLGCRGAPHLLGDGYLGRPAFAAPVADHEEVEAAVALRWRGDLRQKLKGQNQQEGQDQGEVLLPLAGSSEASAELRVYHARNRRSMAWDCYRDSRERIPALIGGRHP